jgi:deoxyribodipyrimidine photo-lyase
MRHVEPPAGAVELSRRAAIVVTDRGYTRIQRLWRATAAERIDCPLIQVESDIVVPVETASNKEETAARTLRPKIHREMHNYLIPVEETEVRRKVRDAGLESLDPAGGDELLRELGLNKGPGRVDAFAGGTARARELLEMFIASKLDRYDADRNDPCLDGLSDLSPYIHFGQISPVYVAIRVQDARSPGTAAFLEELIIRRELAVNFVHHNEGYNSFQGLPRWCRETLMEHGMDERPYTYSLEQLEQARTHDPYWNSAQTQMVKTGKMHGYMRMYWGKKIMEWTGSVEDAYSIALYLNDRFELDGRDPNGYAGVAWCFGKHDRPWAARPVFGSIRYMNDKGLKRKFDADAYVTKVKALK